MRADGIVVQDDTMMFVSNPRSDEGSDLAAYYLYLLYKEFQSTLPRGERPNLSRRTNHRRHVSIHAPTRGATLTLQCLRLFPFRFNPRSHEGSDPEQPFACSHCNVSIHAPTRGATHKSQTKVSIYFVSIHAPTRGATVHHHSIKT